MNTNSCFRKSVFYATFFTSCFYTGLSNAKRPNILFAFGDDLGRYFSAYHDLEGGETPLAIVNSPTADRLAAEGAMFLNAHVCAPSSTPSRSSLLSGQYFWRTGLGAILQGAVWDENIPSYPLILQANGYYIGFTYKVWSPGVQEDAPYGGQKNAFEKYGTDFCGFSQKILSKCTEDEEIELEKQRLYDEVVGNFQEFLDSRPDSDTPFCYWWGPQNTHRQWAKGSGKKLWGINPDDLKGKMPKTLPDVPEIREDFADYLGEVQAFDHALGLIIKKLEEIGELDNTVIVVSGDHGIPGFPRGKCNLYNLGTRVPLIVRYPSMVKAGRVIDDFVNLMDLAPTFLELGGITPPDVMTGKSLVPLLESQENGQIDPNRTFVVTGIERHVASAREGNLPYPRRAITTSKYKYIRNFEPERWPLGSIDNQYPDLDGGPTKSWFLNNLFNELYKKEIELGLGKKPYEELYDLEKDPDEMINVAQDPNYSKIKNELAEKLEKVLIESGDPRMQSESCPFEKYPFTVSYQ